MNTNSSANPKEWHVTSVRLRVEELRALRIIAARNDRSTSAELRDLVSKHIEGQKAAA